jgi:quercetin dioxygenase-like cupin family protein
MADRAPGEAPPQMGNTIVVHDTASRSCNEPAGSPAREDTLMADGAFDLHSTFVHLGRESTVTPLPDFAWTPEYLESYEQRFAGDGPQGRLVTLSGQVETWTSWERHPAGEELVVLLSGRVDVIQDLDDGERMIELRPGEALINPRGVWHTSNVHEPGEALFITAGMGTEHRSR